MKNAKIFLMLLASTLLLNACLPNPLEVDGIPTPEEQVVLGSQFIPDQFLVLSLSKTITALEAVPSEKIDSLINAILIPDLDIKINLQNTTYQLNQLSPGLYGADDLPQIPGEMYSVYFINPFNQDTTRAQSRLLPQIPFDKVEPTLRYTEFDTLLTVNYSLNDPLGSNWYMLNTQKISSEDYNLTRRPFTELLSDKDFDGELYEGSFEVFFRDFSPQDTVLISIANISEDYFNFLELRNQQEYLLLDELGEPVNYPSNVENGLGFFNLHIPDIRFFDLSEY